MEVLHIALASVSSTSPTLPSLHQPPALCRRPNQLPWTYIGYKHTHTHTHTHTHIHTHTHAHTHTHTHTHTHKTHTHTRARARARTWDSLPMAQESAVSNNTRQVCMLNLKQRKQNDNTSYRVAIFCATKTDQLIAKTSLSCTIFDDSYATNQDKFLKLLAGGGGGGGGEIR